MYSYEEFEKLVHAGQRSGQPATVGALADLLNLKLRDVLEMAADSGYFVFRASSEDRATWTIQDDEANVNQCKACRGPMEGAGAWADHDVCSPRCYLLTYIDGIDAGAGETLQQAIEQLIGGAL